MVAPLTIAVTGIAIIPKKAERALLDVEISSTGFSRAFISEEVQLSCRRLEDLLRKTSAANDTQIARDSATVAHWLGTFASQVAVLPYTLIHSVRWALTSTTRQAHESQLRSMAAEDALERAKDYAKALGLSAVWPVEVKEAQWGSHDPNAVMKVQEKAMDMRRPVSDSDPAFADLFFEPEEVTMSTRIDCKFEAE
ncbi:hypothetical protein E4T38_02401 [Aureobasidium subglaciale]|nr:hypothetical protein E4T38_02401 [Aureobasidium subglaciale]KAI5228098.1 hypothetical protein E4T40_02180 [Aureobasidium subglaciale]KAI5231423.1 hypothetical protein E4T41_02400 [Aureobasidium subglaciale]KAI5265518.1 hypothetical protein E4T46_02178 [Aureobasidium subglaciale]